MSSRREAAVCHSQPAATVCAKSAAPKPDPPVLLKTGVGAPGDASNTHLGEGVSHSSAQLK
eukprot:756445-Amphidinium_carterae.1